MTNFVSRLALKTVRTASHVLSENPAITARAASTLSTPHIAAQHNPLPSQLASSFAQKVNSLGHPIPKVISPSLPNSQLYKASMDGDVNTATTLIGQGANPNWQHHPDGMTPLMEASALGANFVVSPLLQNGANPRTVDDEGRTALHHAAANGHSETSQLLLKSGSDINAQDSKGNTPVMLAIKSGAYETVKTLIRNGADLNIRTKDGQTPLSAACVNRHYNIAEAISKAGGGLDGAPRNFTEEVVASRIVASGNGRGI